MTNRVTIKLTANYLAGLLREPRARKIVGVTQDEDHVSVRLELGNFVQVPVVDGKPDDVFVSSSALPTVEQMVPGGVYLLSFRDTQLPAAREFIGTMGQLMTARWPDESDRPVILVALADQTTITRVDSAGWSVKPDEHGTFSAVGPDLVIPSLSRDAAARVCLAMAVTEGTGQTKRAARSFYPPPQTK